MDDLLTTIQNEASSAPKHSALKKACQETLDVLEDEKKVSNMPPFQLRSKCLEALQLAIESRTAKIVAFGIGGIQRMVNDDRFQSVMDNENDDRWMPIQIINTLVNTPTLPDDTQVEVMKVLLNMTFSTSWCTNSKVIIKISELCLNCYLSCSKQFLRQACIHTLSESVGGCYRRSSHDLMPHNLDSRVCIDTFISNCQSNVRTAIRATFTQMFTGLAEKLYYNSSTTTDCRTSKRVDDVITGLSDNSDENKQMIVNDVIEVIQFLCDKLTATQSMNQYKPIVPLLLEGLLTVLKNLPATIKDEPVFIQLLWKQLCPNLIAMLGNPKADKNVISSYETDTELGRGSGSSSSAPSIAESTAKTIYSVAVELVKLVGSLRSLRPVLESVFHRMLLYPPPHHRLEAVKIIKQLLTSTEGLLYLAGPTIPDDITTTSTTTTLPHSNSALLKLVMDSIQECCHCNDSTICFTSVSCVDDLLKVVEQFCRGENLNETIAMSILEQFSAVNNAMDGESEKSNKTVTDKNTSEQRKTGAASDLTEQMEIQSTGTDIAAAAASEAPGAAERAQRREEYSAAERQMANDYILRVLQILPNLLEMNSIQELDEALQAFSSNFCTGLLSEQQRNTEAREMVPLLNADGVYIATYQTLLLNLKLIKCGYYAGHVVSPVTQDDFISNILHGEMLLFLSDSWLSEVYQQVTKLNLLQMAGFDSTQKNNMLINALMDIDGLESRKLGGQMLQEYAPDDPCEIPIDNSTRRIINAGMRFSKAILVSCWDSILDVLSVLLNGKSSCGITDSLSLMLGTEGAKEEVKRAQEAICMSLDGLQRAARLACLLGLQDRCGNVFAQLANASCVIEDNKGSPILERKSSKVPLLSALKPKLPRLHAAHALSLDVVLSTGFEMGSHAADCWPHLFRCCAHVSRLEHMYFSSGNNQANLPKVQHQQQLTDSEINDQIDIDYMSPPVVPVVPSTPNVTVPELITQNGKDSFKHVLSAAQMSKILCSLSQQVDRLYEDVSYKLTMESLIHFLGEFCKISSQQLFSSNRQLDCTSDTDSGGIPANAVHLYRLGDVMLKCIKSYRPLMHIMRAWCTVAPHFVEAACHRDRRISKKAVACMHDFVTTLLSGRQELPHFHFNELLCKPFENLLCMEMCDGDVQDQIVCSICELVEACTTEICSGWRPLFAALRAVKIEFTMNEEINEARERHVAAVLDVFEVFLNTDNVLVFANAAVDCVMCLLKYVRGPGEFDEEKDEDDSDSSDFILPESSENLCLPALKYLQQCSTILARMWNMPACPIFHGAHSIRLNSVPKCVDPVIPNMNLDAFRKCFHSTGADTYDEQAELNVDEAMVHYSSEEYFTHDEEHDYDVYTDSWCSHAAGGGCVSRLDINTPTRTLSTIDNHTGVLHVWFLLFEGLASSVSQCPKSYQPQSLEMLFELLRSAATTPGPEFGIHCINHLLLPMLQSWLRQCTRSHGYWEGSPANFKQCCGLCTDLVVEYIVQFVGCLEDLSGLEFMLKQLLDILVECISQPVESIARLGCSCIRHALLSAGVLFTECMWYIATESLLHALHVTMYSTQQLMTLFHANSDNFYGDIGQVKVAARRDCDITESERLKQLALQVFLLDSQRSNTSSSQTETEPDTEKDRSYVFLIYPPEHRNSINPDHILSRVPFRSVVVGLLSHQLLLQTIGAILLQGCSNIANNEHHLLRGRRTSSTTSSIDNNLPGLLGNLSTRNVVTLLQCLQESYKMATEFDSRPGLKFLIQKVAKSEVAANLYKQAGISMTFLLHALIEIGSHQNELTVESVKSILKHQQQQQHESAGFLQSPFDRLFHLQSNIDESHQSIIQHIDTFILMLYETSGEVCNTYINMVVDKEGTTRADQLSEQPLFFLVAQPDEISELKREKSLMTIVAEKLKQQQQQQQQLPEPAASGVFITAPISIQGVDDDNEEVFTQTSRSSSPPLTLSKRDERVEQDSKLYTVATDQTIKNLMSEYKKRKQQHSMPRRKIQQPVAAADSQHQQQQVQQQSLCCESTELIEKQQKHSIMKDSEAHIRSWTEMICTFLSLLDQLPDDQYKLLLPIVFNNLNSLIRYADDSRLRESLSDWVFKLGQLSHLTAS
ncbi:brefeldin A-inhibited guanine nucleotide-exchange protein 3-like [Tubulanus polymorphus]|uniref:brefeldin A-inhibited guanine nucleotide-exchange protein 3-like n=1 Tax=Tubulanus polymorphus TaxID=672921 RepID=UPI003DA5B924